MLLPLFHCWRLTQFVDTTIPGIKYLRENWDQGRMKKINNVREQDILTSLNCLTSNLMMELVTILMEILLQLLDDMMNTEECSEHQV